MSEEISCSFQFGALISLHKLRQIGLPKILHVRPLEERHASLICLERLLIELVLLHTTGTWYPGDLTTIYKKYYLPSNTDQVVLGD